jgi:hypothetical protein
MKFFRNVISCTVLAIAASSHAAEKLITLVEGGRTNSTIVIAADPTPAANLAAIEVQFFVERMTGAKLPIADDLSKVTGNRILIGKSKFTDKLGLDASQYHQMESLIQFFPDTVVLLGRDDLTKDCRSFAKTPGQVLIETASTIDYAEVNGIDGKRQEIFIPGMFDYQGSLRATYRFLEDWCDVRVFGPTPINVHIPQQKTLAVSGGVHHHRSGIDTKSGALGINGRRSGDSQYGPRPSTQEAALYSRRVRWGGEPWYVNHTFQHFNYKNRFISPVEPTDKEAANYTSLRRKS